MAPPLSNDVEEKKDDNNLTVAEENITKVVTEPSTPPSTLSGLALLQHILNAVPSRGYVQSATPIEHMPRLSKKIGQNGNGNFAAAAVPQLYVKRDDLLPLAGGGSKTRKLDYLVQDALDAGCNVLVTSGAVQSNHCRLTASAAARECDAIQECHLILEERIPGSYTPHGAGGNQYLFDLLGAHTVPAKLGQVATVQEALVRKIEQQCDDNNKTKKKKKVYVIPGGGSNALGALGYVRCAAEIIQQSEELFRREGKNEQQEPCNNNNGNNNKRRLYWDAIVTCSGSGGTHTGLLTGLRAAGYTDTPVIGVSVRFDAATQRERIRQQCNALLNSPYFAEYINDMEYFMDDNNDDSLMRRSMPEADVVVVDDHVGPGYSLKTEEMAEAIQAFARLESIILDPVYTGKGAAGLISLARSGRFGPDKRILFIHTGGAPSLYHYQTLPSTTTHRLASM